MAGTTDPTVIGVTKTTKPGWQTSEFWTMIGIIGANVAGYLPVGLPGWLITALGAVYAISRGMAKSGNVTVQAPPAPPAAQ